MASETDIANRALSKLGDVRITSMLDDNKPGRAMNARFDLLRDAELEAHPWRFAVTRTTLPALTTAPSWGYARAFERPADDLRPLVLGGVAVQVELIGNTVRASSEYSHYDPPYEIFGREIHTDLTAPLQYEYVQQVTDTGMYPALFVEALACRLAWDAAEELTQSAGKVDDAKDAYAFAIREARRVNALWRPPARRGPGRWEISRYGG